MTWKSARYIHQISNTHTKVRERRRNPHKNVGECMLWWRGGVGDRGGAYQKHGRNDCCWGKDQILLSDNHVSCDLYIL